VPRWKSVLFEFSKRRELSIERCYRLRCKRVASAFAATLNSNIEWCSHADVMEWYSQRSEWLQEPRSNDAVQDDKIPATRISLHRFCDNVDDHSVLLMGFGQIRRYRAILHKIPEIIGVKMHFR